MLKALQIKISLGQFLFYRANRRQGLIDLFPKRCYFILEELHKIITTQVIRDSGLNAVMVLGQPGYSAEEEPGVVLIFLY